MKLITPKTLLHTVWKINWVIHNFRKLKEKIKDTTIKRQKLGASFELDEYFQISKSWVHKSIFKNNEKKELMWDAVKRRFNRKIVKITVADSR